MLNFHPIYQPRPWGGRALEHIFQRDLPEGRIGESWEIVDRKVEQSQISNGPHAGKSLKAVLDEAPEWLMGPFWEKGKPFPLLVKWLDCADRLSLQVHPPEKMAVALNTQPKTECWYVAYAKQNAALLLEPPQGISMKSFEDKLAQQKLEDLLVRVPTHADDACFVPSGSLHAIDGGNLILEIQQNSDTTYRAYDWGRVDGQGKPRSLHVREVMQCLLAKHDRPKFTPHEPGKIRMVVDCPHFRIRRFILEPGEWGPSLPSGIEPRIFSVSQGIVQTFSENQAKTLFSGTNSLLAYGESLQWKASTKACVLVTDHFVQRN
jgi:mannose-6-phosphate isomerase